jgi:hypothetical protein
VNRDLERRIKKLELKYVTKLLGHRNIRIVWKKAPKTPLEPDRSVVPSTSDSIGTLASPICSDAKVDKST